MLLWTCDEESDLLFEDPKKSSTKFKLIYPRHLKFSRSSSGMKNKTTKSLKHSNGIRTILKPGPDQALRAQVLLTHGLTVERVTISTSTLSPHLPGKASDLKKSITTDSHPRSCKRKTSAKRNVSMELDFTTVKQSASCAY